MADNIKQIAQTLTKDTSILRNILRFVNLLEIDGSDLATLQEESRLDVADNCYWIEKILKGWSSKDLSKTVGDLILVLNSMQCEATADILANEFPPSTILQYRKNNAWKVEDPVSTFVGRQEEMSLLDTFLNDEGKQFLVISGVGGQGKAQLCRRWIQRLRTLEDFPKIIWLEGENEMLPTSSLTHFVEEMTGLTDECNFLPFEQILYKAIVLLKDEKKILWVFDSVDSETDEIKTLSTFLREYGNSKVVIISRFRNIFPAEVAHYLKVDSLSITAAHQLVHDNLSGDETREDIMTLCEEMSCHALALQLSIEFIKKKQFESQNYLAFGILQFLQMFKKNKALFFNEKETVSRYNKSLRDHVETMIHILQKRKKSTAEQILHILSLLQPGGIDVNSIVDFYESAYRKFEDRSKVTAEVISALNVLRSLSLIYIENPGVMIYPLTQEILRVVSAEWKTTANLILKEMDVENLASHLQHVLKLWEIVSEDDTVLRKQALRMEKIYKALENQHDYESLTSLTESHRDKILRIFENDLEQKEVKMAQFYYEKALDYGRFSSEGNSLIMEWEHSLPVPENWKLPGPEKDNISASPKMNQPPLLELPKTFQNLKLKSYLGSGSFGIVWKVEKEGTEMALKVTLADAETEAKQENEFTLAANLEHANLVKFHSFKKLSTCGSDLKDLLPLNCATIHSSFILSAVLSKQNINIFLVEMQLCGEDLRTWLEISHDPGLQETRSLQYSIVTGINEGIKYLHGEGIVHRDLKPENIMFSQQGFQIPVKIGDYGTCRIVKSVKTFTATSNIGTDLYRAPEVNHNKYSFRSDLFSVGLIIWEVIQLIPSKDLRSYFDQLVNDKNESLIQPNEVILNFRDVVTKLCMRISKTRYQTAEEIDIIWGIHATSNDIRITNSSDLQQLLNN